MIISHKLEIIFLKTRKTAGTSIETLLAAECGPDDIITPLGGPYDKHRYEMNNSLPQNYTDSKRLGGSGVNSKVKGDFRPHSTLQRIRKNTHSQFDHYLKVAVHRDVASFMLSLYEFQNRVPDPPRFDQWLHQNFSLIFVNHKIAPIRHLDHTIDFSNLEEGFASVPRIPEAVVSGLSEIRARSFTHQFSREEPADVWREFGLHKELELAIKIESLLRVGQVGQAKRLLVLRRLL